MEQAKSVTEADLLNSIEAFCAATNTAETAVGLMALNDPNLVRDLRAGRELRRGTRKKVLDMIGGGND